MPLLWLGCYMTKWRKGRELGWGLGRAPNRTYRAGAIQVGRPNWTMHPMTISVQIVKYIDLSQWFTNRGCSPHPRGNLWIPRGNTRRLEDDSSYLNWWKARIQLGFGDSNKPGIINSQQTPQYCENIYSQNCCNITHPINFSGKPCTRGMWTF